MMTGSKNFGFKATAVGLVTAVSLTLAAPAFADGRHHGGGYYDRHGYYGGGHHRGHDDDGLAAVAIIGGVLLGAALLSSASQPVYAQPEPVYAPPPSYGSSYGYDEQPIQAVPSSDIYQTQAGQYCREYQSSVRVGGQMQRGYGTACQQPDGSWRVVN
jgi:surface antigen